MSLLVLSIFTTAWLAYDSMFTTGRQHQALDIVDNLTGTDARLARAVLEARMAPLANYDILNGELTQMRFELGQIAHLTSEIGDQKVSGEMARLERDLEIMASSVDDFRRDNAIVKNSLQYFPHVIHDLILSGEQEKAIPRADLAMLSHIMLLYMGQATPDNRAQLDLWLATVKSAKLRLSRESARKLDLGLSHARNIRDVLPRLDETSSRLTSRESRDEFKQLHDRLSTVGRAHEGNIHLLLVVFVLFTIFMMALLLQFWRRHVGEMHLAATVFDASPEGIMITDAKTRILNVNPAFCKMRGYLKEELLGMMPKLLKSERHPREFYQNMWAAINKTGQWSGEITNRRRDGEISPEWLSINTVRNANDDIVNYVAVYTDLLQRYEAEEKIRFIAYHDPLTNLPNRRLLVDRVNHALAASTRLGRGGALLILDLDHFKTLNDTVGHSSGDLLLQQVAERLTSSVREGDTVARLGGDEYVVMLEDLSKQPIEAAAQAETIANKILAALNQPYQLANYEYQSTASIGVVLFSDHDQSQEDLLKHADIAMYQAKKAGRNTLRFYDSAMQGVINARADLERELRKAVDKQQFHLYYQVQIDSSGRPLGAEALIRWLHPERGLVSPLHFIPLAEDTGLILPIGQWVLHTACAQLKAWSQNEISRDLTLSINVSAKQFHQADFVAQV
jgi:diguanylate cyclase (GGDEF)-like protein/PAS domain S-box-containing protein